jgi:predicted HicB family RNase H-like nuclease
MAKPSGKTQIRLPPALHAELIRRADQQGISLNALMVALLAGGVGFKLDK